jgi:hypothetical protein
MPQIDVYIFRFFPLFIFVIFAAVYLNVYFLMLPSLVSVLKFRIRYRQNLEADVIKLKYENTKMNLFSNVVYGIFSNFGGAITKDFSKAYINEMNSSQSLNKFKIVKL